MSGFDPKAFLAKYPPTTRQPAEMGELSMKDLPPDTSGGTEGGFNPKAFLAKTAPPQDSVGGKAQAFLESAGNEISFGYLPQIQAGIESIMPNPNAEVDAKLQEQGFQLSPEDKYLQMRDSNLSRMASQEKQYPNAALGGKVAGVLTTMSPIASGAKALGLAGKATSGLGRLKEGIKMGAVMGAGYNPGDTQGVVAPLQLTERGKGAAISGGLGAGGQLLGEGLSSAGQSVKSAPQALEDFSKAVGFKSLGAGIKEFRRAFGKNSPLEIGDTLIKKNIVKAGSSVEDMLPAIEAEKEVAGKTIGAIYKETDDFIKNPENLKSLPAGIQYKLKATALNGAKLADAALKRIEKTFKNNLDNSQVKERVNAVMENLKNKGDDISITDLQDMKSTLDDSINWSKSANEATVIQDQLRTVREVLNKSLQNRISAVSKAMKDPSKVTELREANKLYGHMSTAKRIAKDKIDRESSNRFFSLTDYIAGGATGASVGEINSPEDLVKKGLYGFVGAVANKGIRKYSLPIVAKSAQTLGKALQQPANFAKYGEPLIEAAKRSPQEFQAVLQQFTQDPKFQTLTTIQGN